MAARRTIAFGDSITGMLIDGVADTPYVAATLTLNGESGALITVPYVDDFQDSTNSTSHWFEERRPPKNLILVSLDGDFSLFGCRYSGHTVNLPRGIGVGKIKPTEIVLGNRDGDHEAPLAVKELRSEIDGLPEWTGFTSIRQSKLTDEDGRVKKVVIEVASLDEMEWAQGEAQMKFASNWVLNPMQAGLTINDGVSLISRFSEPQSISTHLHEHRKVTSLLAFIYGCPIYFRRHEVKDASFATKTLGGRVVDVPFRQLISQHTVNDHAKPKPPKQRLQHPLAHQEQIGKRALEAWSSTYDNWGRFIFPAVSALNRPGAILENLVVNAAMSMEAAGSLIGCVAGEAETYTPNNKPKTATYMYRCLSRAGWSWGEISESTAGLAQAMANNYNTIKHFDRGEFPDQAETYLISATMNLIVRMLSIRLATGNHSNSFFGEFVHDYEVLQEEFSVRGLRVNAAGSFVTRP